MTTPKLPAHWRPWIEQLLAAHAAKFGVGATVALVTSALWIAQVYLPSHPLPTKPGTLTPIPITTSTTTRTDYEWRAERLVIAGVDRDWPYHDPAATCDQIVAAGCNAVSFEMVAQDTVFKAHPEQARAPFTAWVREARARKLIVFACIFNSWVDSDSEYAGARVLRGILIEQGPEGIIAQALGETHGSGEGPRFEAETLQMLKAKGFKTCYNGNGGRPSGKNGCDYFAWHTCDGGKVSCPPGGIEITDCGGQIRWLGNPADPTKTETLARAAKARGCGFGLYGYRIMADGPNPQDKTLPLAAWQAMRRVYAGTPSITAPGSDGVQASSLRVQGHNQKPVGTAKIVATMSGLRKVGGNVECKVVGWPAGLPLDRDGLDAVSVLVWRSKAEAFDHHRPDGKESWRHDLNNLYNGYANGPSTGDQWGMYWISNDGTKRTTICLAEEPWK